MDVDIDDSKTHQFVNFSRKSNNFQKHYKNNHKVEESRVKRNEDIDYNRKQQRELAFQSNRTMIKDEGCIKTMATTKELHTKIASHVEEVTGLLTIATNFRLSSTDCSSDYLVKYCPAGTRVIIEAKRNRTSLISMDGRLLLMFHSKLPGGYCNKRDKLNANSCSYLDGIYVEERRKLYVLDVMRLGPDNLADVPCISRCQLLESYVRPVLQGSDFQTEVDIGVVAAMSYDQATLRGALQRASSWPHDIDGILLYKRFESYSSGPSHSLKWVALAQIPELLSEGGLPFISEKCLMEIDPAEMENKRQFRSPF